MANYCCTIRTNYFHVKDEEVFKSLMSKARGSEDAIQLWEDKDENGKTVFAFGVYGGIYGINDGDYIKDADVEKVAYEEFFDSLQECVADDDAIIIFEVGNEKMRYVVGSANIITSSDALYLDIKNTAIKKARKLLGNPSWRTKCEY